MKVKGNKIRKTNPKVENLEKSGARSQEKFDIFRLLDNEDFLRALKEKLETV